LHVLFAQGDFELHALALRQAAMTFNLDLRLMDEEVLPAGVVGDEPSPLSALNHLTVPVAIAAALSNPRERRVQGTSPDAASALRGVDRAPGPRLPPPAGAPEARRIPSSHNDESKDYRRE
jgi:hypothetical protein